MKPLTKIKFYNFLLFLLFSIYVTTVGAAEGDVRIGVLAKRGDELTIQRWQPTADYLTQQIPQHRFVIVPLNFVEIDQVVKKGGVDFVLANSAIYVGLEKRFGVGRIATMRNRNGHRGYTVFGGVIFTRADRKDINELSDISGKKFAAVKENSFGGYHMAWREMAQNGITPSEDTVLQFSGTHDAVVEDVLNGQVDAGTVRSDTLERMSDEGRINLQDIKIINQQSHADFGYIHSTRLYPEWPFARVAHTSEELSHAVATALLRLPPDGKAALAGQTAGWTVPGNYKPVHDLLRELRIDPYANLGRITFADLIKNYAHWLLLISLSLLLLGVANAYVANLNRRLRKTESELRGARDNLIDKVRERTAELQESHKRLERVSQDWNDAFDAINDPIFIHDTDMCIVQANPAYCECAGRDLEEMLGKPYYNFFPRMDGPLPGCVDFPDHSQSEESELRLDNGEVYVSHAYGIRRADNTILHAIHILEDVTAQSQAESEMRRLNRALRTLSLCNTTLVHAENESELMSDICHILIDNGGYGFSWVGYADGNGSDVINPVAYAGDGGELQQVLNDSDKSDGADKLAMHALRQNKTVVLRDLSDCKEYPKEWCKTAKASGFAAAIALPLISQGDRFGVLSIFSHESNAFDHAEINLLQEMAGDLSFGMRTLRSRIKRRQAEIALRKTEERYEELYENAPSAYLSVSGDDGKLIQFNRAMCEILGYSRHELEGMTISELYANTEYGLSRAKRIFTEGGVRNEELQMRHADGNPVWVSVSIDTVKDENGNLLESRSMVNDISARKLAEEESSHFAEQLQRSLLQTIRAIALTIEKRDPYTAGHQERVAELAVNIGKEMGLDDDNLEGLRLGAMIHDIGKISIPAEILSRPGALEPEMFGIIKTHPRSGYDIIRGIDFPWPLADVVLQHHERMDGSGYPDGLKGDEILLDARILAVADIVEAMASHRPYRAGLGFERALEEIERGKGTQYDPQVVDACQRVFRDEDSMSEWVKNTEKR
jgi:PAS domain S-box-containing protein